MTTKNNETVANSEATKFTGDCSRSRDAAGYRLIDESDVIRPTDEFLEHDAETWTPVDGIHRWMVGSNWCPIYVPIRRPFDNMKD